MITGKEKKDPKALIPKEIQVISKQVFGKSHLAKRHYKGQEETPSGVMEKWENTGIIYLVDVASAATKLKNLPPNVYVSQDKNLKLLLALTEQQQFGKDNKEAKAQFTLAEYAKLRGYTDDEISRGGKFMDELKRDLYSGAYVGYQIPITKNGKEYTRHGTFYTLDEPNSRKSEWVVSWNGGYAEAIKEILNGTARQYFSHLMREVGDRRTTEQPLLHKFFNYLVFTHTGSGGGLCTLPTRIKSFLEHDIGLSEDDLKRPQNCFDLLQEGITYIAENYPEELTSIIIYNRKRNKELKIQDIGKFNTKTYSTFKDSLQDRLGEEDIRKCCIAFCRTKSSVAVLPELLDEPKRAPLSPETQKLIDDMRDRLINNKSF